MNWAKVLLLLGALLLTKPSLACVQCNCGDPTIAALGVEQPYRNRLRLALDERVSSHTMGAVDPMSTRVLRSTLHVLWAPHSRVLLSAALPWLAVWTAPTGVGFRQPRAITGLGDLELTGRFVVFRDRRFSPRHLLAITAGLKTPTGPRVKDDNGYPLPEDEQPGSGSWDPLIGVSHAWLSGELASIVTAASYRHGTTGRRGEQRGGVFLGLTQVQLQPLSRLAIAGGIEVTHRRPDRFATDTDQAKPDSGGTVVWFAPALLIAPTPSLVIRIGATIPMGRWLYGTQREGPQAQVALAWDVH